MQLFNISQPRPLPKLPVAVTVPSSVAAPETELEAKPESCGWYDSSFELAAGLEISEQDDDLLYQLCQYFLH
ncbi:hypothetical protein [Roseateles sp.]|uniref:hypothetical protein n=1 Tax=Roseateles sp. TaxID=1971397 RepID=UPI0032678D3A